MSIYPDLLLVLGYRLRKAPTSTPITSPGPKNMPTWREAYILLPGSSGTRQIITRPRRRPILPKIFDKLLIPEPITNFRKHSPSHLTHSKMSPPPSQQAMTSLSPNTAPS